MLHVRVASPPDVTGRLVEALVADQGVLNLVVLEGAARRPDRDAVQFDLRQGSANPVFRQLRSLGLDERGSIMVQAVDAALTDATPQAAIPGTRHGEVAPVWEMVEAGIRDGGVYAPSFFGLLIIAGLIACVGILTNSQILVEPGRGSALQLLLNVSLLILVGAAGLRIQRFIWRPRARRGSA